MSNILYLLTAIVSFLKRLSRRREQREAQNERNEIDEDSAQYSADKFGDGRVRSLSGDADEANDPERDRSDGG